MTEEKSVLVVGLDPTLIDFSKPGLPAGHGRNEGTCRSQMPAEDELTRLGYSVQMCLTDFGETAEAVVQSALKQKRFDCVLNRGRCTSEPKQLHPV